MNKIILKIGGMTCTSCSNSLEKHLNKQEGIINANVNLILEEAYIEYEDNITLDDLNRYVNKSGFKSLGISKNTKEKTGFIPLIIFSCLAVILLTFSILFMIAFKKEDYPEFFLITSLVLIIPFLIYGIDIFKSGIKGFIHLHPNMNSLVTLGVFTSFIYSFIEMILIFNGDTSYLKSIYFESCAIVIYFIKLGRFIDHKGKVKTKKAITSLMEITPPKAILLKDGKEIEIDIDEVNKDDLLVLKPGMKASSDGIVISGAAHFDEAFLTGEAVSKKKEKDSNIIAGSINLDGYITYKAIKTGRDSTISEIVNLVKEAANSKAKISKLADRISLIFVPMIILIALLSFIIFFIVTKNFNTAIIKFTTILVIACPCALGLATPLALVVAHGLCASNGILVKNSSVLEDVNSIDTLVFDKTGTLTIGHFSITKLFNHSNYSDSELLNIISNIEAKSTHPISKAFNIKKELEISDFKTIEGVGISAKINDKTYILGSKKVLTNYNLEYSYNDEINELINSSSTIIYIVEKSVVIGLIGVNDTIKDNAVDVINHLKEMNKELILLTGDNSSSAKKVGNLLSIDNVISEVYPKDKKIVISNLMNDNKKVMMIGDGINDAPSLVSANVGVSINKDCNIASDSSDIILINDNLESVINIFTISKYTFKIIKENLFWAFFYNLLMIPIALGALEFAGVYMNPMWASLAMMISSITVTINSLRIRRVNLWKRKS
ncbi:MAG: cation-translocating P-type ATPase [Acholeplasmatales bacterium]|nr:cation-translocating P-type ATPase [Acholeplasmatales bacterium]